jgi:propanediol dehydratase small subunit
MPTYPLYDNDADALHAGSGRALRDVTLEAVLDGSLTLEDVQVHRSALVAQADIARAAGYAQLAENLERAAELTVVPRSEIIEMYNLLRPGRSRREELDALAQRLEDEFQAMRCAAMVREAAEVYTARGLLRHPDAL